MSFFGLRKDPVFVRPELTRSLARQLKGSLDNVATSWAVPTGADRNTFPPAPSESTIQSWVTNGFPSKLTGSGRYHLLAFCSQFDVDPLSLFDFHRNGYFSRFAAIRKALQRGMGALGAFAPLFELYEPDDIWPSDMLAQAIWGRKWDGKNFDNQQQYLTQDYALLNLTFLQPSLGVPRAAHIAYRRWNTREFDSMWRYYGTVIGVEDRIELYNENAVHQKSHRYDNDTLAFRTYFGGRPVEFRLASLHEFKMSITFPFNDMSVIGFDW